MILDTAVHFSSLKVPFNQQVTMQINHTKVSLYPKQKNSKLVLPSFNSSEQTLSTKKHVSQYRNHFHQYPQSEQDGPSTHPQTEAKPPQSVDPTHESSIRASFALAIPPPCYPARHIPSQSSMSEYNSLPRPKYYEQRH
mmetsp:Transcript_12468/g.26332  ORF Transcript_12468/g.26332 Transcript_12468/m.26332 type:complete len:139 (+) Transcript_12468:37-453(+)